MSDDEHLIKLKQARASDSMVAARLGLSPEEVRLRWKQIQEMEDAAPAESSGSKEFVEFGRSVVESYRLTTCLMDKFIQGAGQVYGVRELEELIRAKPDGIELSVYLSQNAIVLKKFILPDPGTVLEETQRSNSHLVSNNLG